MSAAHAKHVVPFELFCNDMGVHSSYYSALFSHVFATTSTSVLNASSSLTYLPELFSLLIFSSFWRSAQYSLEFSTFQSNLQLALPAIQYFIIYRVKTDRNYSQLSETQLDEMITKDLNRFVNFAFANLLYIGRNSQSNPGKSGFGYLSQDQFALVLMFLERFISECKGKLQLSKRELYLLSILYKENAISISERNLPKTFAIFSMMSESNLEDIA
jgi:hypothetical protein